jgi:hypothetical protein
MWTTALILSALVGAISGATVWPQPAKATYDASGSTLLSSSFKFVVAGGNVGGPILREGIKRYETLLAAGARGTRPVGNLAAAVETLDSVSISVKLMGEAFDFGASIRDSQLANTRCEYLYFPAGRLKNVGVFVCVRMGWAGVDESYKIKITAASTADNSGVLSEPTGSISATTVFGALRGLETFVQLAIHSNTYTPGALSVPLAVDIEDEPRFLCVILIARFTCVTLSG